MVSAPTAWGVRSLSFAPMYWGGGLCLSREFMPVCLSLCLRVLLCLCVCVCVCVLVFLCDIYCLTLHLIVSWIWVVVSLTCYSHLFHLKWYLSLDLGLKKKSSPKSFLKTSRTFWNSPQTQRQQLLFLGLGLTLLYLPKYVENQNEIIPPSVDYSENSKSTSSGVTARSVACCCCCEAPSPTYLQEFISHVHCPIQEQKMRQKSAKIRRDDAKALVNTFLMPPAVTDKHIGWKC